MLATITKKDPKQMLNFILSITDPEFLYHSDIYVYLKPSLYF